MLRQCRVYLQRKGNSRMLEAAQSSEVRNGVAERLPTVRSRVTNGAKMIAGVDGRSADARRYRDLAMSFADDCGVRLASRKPNAPLSPRPQR